MGNKQDELETMVSLENYDIVAIRETCWDRSHKQNAATEGFLGETDREGGPEVLLSMFRHR